MSLGTSLALLLAACGGPAAPEDEREASATAGGQTVGPHHGEQMEQRAGMMGGSEMLGMMCPMMSDQTEVTVEEIEGGAALIFTTSEPDQVHMLREHVAHMAAMPGWRGAGRGPRGAQMPPASAAATEIDGGARLELRAREEADVNALRESVRERAERMTTRECPMMRAGTTAMR